MSKIEKILSIILLCLFLASITSCVTKKKLKESQELQTTYLLDQTKTKWTNSVQKLENNFSESTLKTVKEYLKSYTESTSTNENESTDISVNIKAEEGKEKTATIGNTTVTSNGADINVKTTSTKSTDKKLETLNKEWSQMYYEERKARISLENEFSEYVKEQNQINESLKAQLDTKTKETDKKGLPFWLVIILIVSAVLFIAFKFFNVKIPFLK